MTEKNNDETIGETLTGNELKKAQARAYILAAEETGFVKSATVMKGRQKQKVWYLV